MISIPKPFLGVAYYPEVWDDSEMDYDINMMEKAGIRVVRIAEFAWSKMEPKEGEYHFEWLHHVIQKLAAKGIATILGTPSATPPIWFAEKYPEAFVLDDSRRRKTHGARLSYCVCNPNYIAHSVQIAKKMAEEFGHNPNVIGWQIDNERDFLGCHCDICKKQFHLFLQSKYGEIEKLNSKWNLDLFSQNYERFDQIPLPQNNVWNSPHLLLEYQNFESKIEVDFVQAQYRAMKPLCMQPIGTDSKPYNRVDYEDLVKELDIVEFNHYDVVNTLPKRRLWFDLLRPLKDIPFWNTETATCWNGSTSIGVGNQSVKPYGFCKINSWLPIILGGEGNMYWLWRTHHAGHEMMHGAILYSSGRPYPIFEEVQKIAKDFEAASDFLTKTKVKSDIAIHFTGLAWKMHQAEGIIDGMQYERDFYQYIYAPLKKTGVSTDVITQNHDLSSYKMLVTGMEMTLEQGDLFNRISNWVRNGGVWVVGPMTDIRDEVGAKYIKSPYGMLESLTGAIQKYEVPDLNDEIQYAWKDGTPCKGSYWSELFDSDGDELVKVVGGYPTLIGKSPVLRKQVGKGVVYIVGTYLCEEDRIRVYRLAEKDAHISSYETDGELVVTPREGKDERGLIVAECANKVGSIVLPYEMTDILSGKRYVGKVNLKPYDLLLLK